MQVRRLSKKLAELTTGAHPAGQVLAHYCAGCDQLHMINTTTENHLGAQWDWNGNPELPTFTPSINIVGVCHYTITNGKISYDRYSLHRLSGQTVDLPNLPEWLGVCAGEWQEDDPA